MSLLRSQPTLPVMTHAIYVSVIADAVSTAASPTSGCFLAVTWLKLCRDKCHTIHYVGVIFCFTHAWYEKLSYHACFLETSVFFYI